MRETLTCHRMNQTMTRMQKMQDSEYSSFLRVMFGLGSPSPVQDLEKEVEWIDLSLNDSQKDAIRFALGSREVALIHGPPGVSTFALLLVLVIIDSLTDTKFRPERPIL